MATSQNLTPEQLAQIRAMRAGPAQYTQASGAHAGLRPGQQWYTDDPFGFSVQATPGGRQVFGGDADKWVDDPSLDQEYIRRLIPDTEGGLADEWDTSGNYRGRVQVANGGTRDLWQAALMMAPAAYGVYAAGAGAAGGASAAAPEMVNGAFLGENVASGVGAWDAAAIKSAVASGELGTAAGYVAQNVSNGSALDTVKGLNSVNSSVNSSNGSNSGGGSVGANGWETMAKLGGGLVASGLAGDALSSPVSTGNFDQLFNGLLTEQGKVSARADDQWQNYLTTFRPLEQKMASTALNWDTPTRRETAANEATGLVASQFDQARQTAARDMTAAGVDASTVAALGAASQIEEAKASAGAANNARTQVEQQGLQLVTNAANFGRGLPQTSLSASGVATGAASTAGSVANASANVQNTNTANRNAMIGDLFGAGLTAYGMYASSKKTKHMGRRVKNAAAAVSKSPAHHWRYRDGNGDGNTKARMGPTAEGLAKVAPAVSDGKKVDAIAMLGLHHAAIAENTKSLVRIEKALGLSSKGA